MDIKSITQKEVNTLSDAEYETYLKLCEEAGYTFRFDGGQPGPDMANRRFFGNKNGRLTWEKGMGWTITPNLVKPDFELRPLQLNAAVFKSYMHECYGVPEQVLDDLIEGKVEFPKDEF